MKRLLKSLAVGTVVAGLGFAACNVAGAAALGGNAQAAIPNEVQQLIVVDYRVMQNSPAAMNLKDRVLPPELKRLEEALKSSGLNENHDVEQLAFASFRVPNGDGTRIVGLAQGQFPTAAIYANFKKQKVKATLVRTTRTYPLGSTGMQVAFLDPTTMLFGDTAAVKSALDARDGITQSMLSNSTMIDMMGSVDDQPVWSILDGRGTQTMMKSVLGDASGVADYDQVKKRLLGSRYTLGFENGVKFNLDVLTPDVFSASTMSSLMSAAALLKKMNATPTEKQTIDSTTIKSSGSTLEVRFSASDSQFASLLKSNLFQSVVR